jgi:hypothetical protein
VPGTVAGGVLHDDEQRFGGTRVNLDRDDLEVAYYVFSRFVNGRLAAGKPIPAAVRPLFHRIELMSVCGHESDSGTE